MTSKSSPARCAISYAALIVASSLATTAFAQQAGSDQPATLEEVVVTAQKRAQNIQDVPIAVTALNAETLQANRIATVNDLSGLAPGVTVRPSVGGVQIPSFTIRGAISYGVVPGSDKQVSIYLDGVYISSPRGSIFDLPDMERIEILRGPQGTLFGRNATAGAVSITTRDPKGEFHFHQEASIGNYDAWRVRTSIDTPQMGPFSGYVSYVHAYKRGEIENAGAGQVWDRRSSPSDLGIRRSPKWLGTIRNDSYFAALKFEPSDNFKAVYKFDHFVDDGTPEGTAFIGFDPNTPLLGQLYSALFNNQPTPFYTYPNAKRPKIVNNSFASDRDQKVTGHSLTATWNAADNITVKNIFAYRKSSIFNANPFDGWSAVSFTSQAVVPYATFIAFSTIPGLATAPPATQGAAIGQIATALAPLIGQPFVGIASQSTGTSKQWSDELQVNYDSKLLTLTAGALWFKGDDVSGSPENMMNTPVFTPIPGGVLPPGNQGISYNKAKSIAAYAQAELHLTDQLDILGGARITQDKKSGRFVIGTAPNFTTLAFTYKKTKPNFMVGVNYKPNDDILLYGKFSTAFVSGGSVAGIDFKPETAKSWEGGVKATVLDGRLRANLALYHVTYKNFQTAQGGSSFVGVFPNAALIAVFVYPQGGPVKSKGFELDGAALLAHGLTAGYGLSYSQTKYSDVDPILIAANGGGYSPSLRPKWTGNLFGQYETDPLFGDATLMARVDATYRGKMFLDQNRNRNIPAFAALHAADAAWVVNGRLALRNLSLGGAKAEVAVWGKNIFNDRSVTFPLIQAGFASATFQPARTFGADLIVDF
jgi:iron complex outermembrane receptor protein